MRTAKAEYAVYKGEQLLCIGKAKECAAELGVSESTIRFYTTPAYQNRIDRRKNPKNYTTAFKLED